MRVRGRSTGQRKKLNCSALVAEASAHPVWSSGAGWLIRDVRDWGCAFVPPCQPVIECWLPLGRGVILMGVDSWSRTHLRDCNLPTLPAAAGKHVSVLGGEFWAVQDPPQGACLLMAYKHQQEDSFTSASVE